MVWLDRVVATAWSYPACRIPGGTYSLVARPPGLKQVDRDSSTAKRFDFGLQRLHPALKPELRCGVSGAEFKTYEARS